MLSDILKRVCKTLITVGTIIGFNGVILCICFSKTEYETATAIFAGMYGFGALLFINGLILGAIYDCITT